MKIGYLIPEFPGQTHIWLWREVLHMREWGCLLKLFSTRPPSERDRGRHAFAAEAVKETLYLVESRSIGSLGGLASDLVWAAVTRPWRLLSCVQLAFSLPVNARPRWRALLPLVPPACRLARRMERGPLEHLHCHSCANGAVLAMMNRRLTGIPFSVTLHADLDWWGGAMREKTAEASFTIVIADWLLSEFRKRFPDLPPEKALLGPMGVDTKKWRRANAPRDWPRDSLQIIAVGRLVPSKGFDVLLQALGQLRGLDRELKLRILGDGPEKASLEALVARLGLQNQVCFLGSVSEETVIKEMADADIFVLASHAEGLGVAVMEAMAMEVATIATSVGGLVEIITNGKDGILVPANDSCGLARALVKLAKNPELRRRLGTQGRQTIIRRFDSRRGAAALFKRLTGYPPTPSQTASSSKN